MKITLVHRLKCHILAAWQLMNIIGNVYIIYTHSNIKRKVIAQYNVFKHKLSILDIHKECHILYA